MLKITKHREGGIWLYQLERKHTSGMYKGRTTVEGGYYRTKAEAEKAKKAWQLYHNKKKG